MTLVSIPSTKLAGERSTDVQRPILSLIVCSHHGVICFGSGLDGLAVRSRESGCRMDRLERVDGLSDAV